MKVVILTEGGRDIGFGHITRCIALYQAFEEKGITPELIVNGDEAASGLLCSENCRIFNWLKEKEALLDNIKDTDIVIVDSYLADVDYYKRIRKSAGIALYIDDNQRINYPDGIILNGSFGAEEMDYPKSEGSTYLLGSRYIPLRKIFWKANTKKIKDNIERIMLFLGGSDHRGRMPKILRQLNGLRGNIKKNVMIGEGYDNIDNIKKEADENTNLIIHPDAEKIKETMAESDIAISGGGQSLYELSRMGLPAVAIAIADNQMRNIREGEKAGVIENAGWWESSELLERICELVEKLRGRDVRSRMSLNAQKLVDGGGALRVYRYLIDRVKATMPAGGRML